ncbi:MAG: OmpH family outer membrane protein [Verrucomicrobiales bacterium]
MRTIKTLSCLVAIALAATCLSTPVGAQDKAINIGLVDMERIFSEYYKTKLAEDEVEKVKEIIKGEVEERRKTHAGLLEEYEALVKKVKDPTLSETIRKGHQTKAEAKGAELRALDAEMKEYAERRRKQLIEQVEKSKAEILNEISKVINDISQADGFDAVFDRGGLSERGFPFVVFVKDSSDLSEKVIKSLNAGAPKTATKATE